MRHTVTPFSMDLSQELQLRACSCLALAIPIPFSMDLSQVLQILAFKCLVAIPMLCTVIQLRPVLSQESHLMHLTLVLMALHSLHKTTLLKVIPISQ